LLAAGVNLLAAGVNAIGRRLAGNLHRFRRETASNPDDSLDDPGCGRTHNRLMTTSTTASRTRDRIMGSLFAASGVLFILGVLNPAVIGSWGDAPAESLAAATGHKAAWYVTTWLITLAVVAGVAAITLLARTLGTDAARVALALYLAGSALALASMTFELTVTSSQIGVPVAPDWYFGVEKWSDGLATAYFALLAPAAMACFGVEIVRTRRLRAWTGVVFGAAAVLLFGQYAAFLGALPFPQFLAFAALGGALLAGRRLDGDPDGDAVDAAGVLGGAEDEGVGPGGDPERFSDLVEQ
jgi:hypothetical protein